MYGVMLSFGAWYRNRHSDAITLAALSVILGWPFVIMIYVPLALDCFMKIGLFSTVLYGLRALCIFLVPSVIVDYYFVKKWTVAVLNIVLYNTTTTRGSTLFGVEPWTFYFHNGTLNFSVAFALSFLGLLLAVVFRKWWKDTISKSSLELILYLLPLYIWLGLMLYLPHKEERFLFVIYPMICLSASLALVFLSEVFEVTMNAFLGFAFRSNRIRAIRKLTTILVFAIFLTLSFSRIFALTIYYRAPLQVYSTLNDELKSANALKDGNVNICVGKEWYRFPSNFFLPQENAKYLFLKSGFCGQLPKPFEKVNGTSIIPSGFNQDNLEEWDRYVDISMCDYLVDLELPDQQEEYYSRNGQWLTLYTAPFLDAKLSPLPHRAFWFGPASSSNNVFDKYVLLKSKTR